MFKSLKANFSAKKLLIFVDRFGLIAILFMLAIAFVAAVFETMPQGQTNLTALVAALVDTITSDAKTATGATKLMHVLLTGALYWAVVKVYMATAGYTWDSFSARYLARRHVVILAGHAMDMKASNSKAFPCTSFDELVEKSSLAVDIALALADQHSVVLNIPGLHTSHLPKLWRAGVKVLKSDIEAPEVLRATGADRAELFIAMRDAYAENIVLTRAALSPSLDNPNLECLCLIEPLSVKVDFRLQDYIEDDSLSRVRVFNESELIARCLVRDYPPDEAVSLTDRGVHLLLVGLGSVGQSITLQLARMGHYRSGKKPKITIIDRHVNDLWNQHLSKYPSITEWVTVDLVEHRIEDVQDSHAQAWLQDESPITMIYVCTKDEIINLRIARLLLRLLDRSERNELSNTPVIALDPPGGCILSEYANYGDHSNRFHLFSLMRSGKENLPTPIAASIVTEMDDRRAQQLHEDYCKNDNLECAKNPGRKKSVANRPWQELPETYRQANRFSADHLDVKLRAVGRVFMDRNEAEEAPLSTEELELLARLEHCRWWAERSLSGWKYGPERNDCQLLHPNMIPFEKLDENIKEYDRKNVMKMIDVAAGQDKVLVRQFQIKHIA